MGFADSSIHSIAGVVRFRRSVAVISVMLMLLSSLPMLRLPTSADPGAWDNRDMTRSVLWNFTDAADYDLYNSSVSGGLGQLAATGGSTGENSTAQYLLGAGMNIDVSAVPDSITIDNASLPVHSIIIQPNPDEGKDNYLTEWFPYWSPPNGSDLTINSEYDPVPSASKRDRIVMQFDLSAVPADAVVRNATLSLYEKPSKSALLNYTIHALTSPWDEVGASWRTNTTTSNWIHYGGDFSAEPFSWGTIDGMLGWHMLDMTRLVDLWHRNATTNMGFIIVPTLGTIDNTKTFVDSEITNKPEQRPKLEISYTLGEAVATYESTVLGPGTNSTFTLASWGEGMTSKASDEFTESSLSPKWDWILDPTLSGGSINFGRPGWLNITGSQSTYLPNASVGCNFLHQDITGDFTAETSLQTFFSTSSMGAGLMMMNDAITWLSIYKTGVRGSESIVAEVAKGGTSTLLGSIAWSSATTFLRMQRAGADYLLSASSNGVNWTTVGSYYPVYDFGLVVSLGLIVSSGGSASRPGAEFDYVRILPAGQTMTLDVSTRTGNSTSLADPSWDGWSAPLDPDTGAVIDSAGKYIQYLVTMRTSYDWLTPILSDFQCDYLRFAVNGTITTREAAPAAFQAWESMKVTQSLAGGDIEYEYSTDHGATWTNLGSGNSFALPLSVRTLMIRAELSSPDTASTPSIDTIEVVYRITHDSFYVEAPATVQAGQSFSIYVEPKDTDNNTSTWTGPITLHAVDSSGVGSASSELLVTQSEVLTGGMLTIAGEEYTVAETIRVLVSGGGATGLSQSITVVPGPLSSVVIEPNVTRLAKNSSMAFTARLCDALGNTIAGGAFTWQADAWLGLLNATTGSAVNLTTVETDSSGYLTVSAAGLSASMYIVVSDARLPPRIDSDIPVQMKTEDFGSWTFDLAPFISDAEDNLTQLRWYTVNETIVKVTGENRTGSLVMTFATVQDMFGTNQLELWVVDSDRMSARAKITVELTAVNDPPKIDPIDPIVVRYDDPYQYDLEFYVSDVEAPPEILTVSVDAASAPYVQVSNLWLTFLYPQSLNGTQQTVFLSVSDGEYVASTVIQVSISNDQVPRAQGPLPEQTMLQGEIRLVAFDLDDYFTDPDGTNLFYTGRATHVAAIIQPNHTVDFYAPSSWAGQEYIVFIAKDDKGARAEGALRMNVIAVNQPPVISNVPNLVVRYGEPYTFDLSPYIHDLDDDQGSLAVTVADPHVGPVGTLLSMTYPYSMVGSTVPVNITVSDGSLTDWWIINVTISSDYPPDLAMAAPDHSFIEDNPIAYPVIGHLEDFFTDRDYDPLTYSVFLSVSNITADVVATDGHWSIEFDPEPNWHGFANMTFRATDGQGALAETTVILRVISEPDAPVLSLPDTFTVTEGSRSLFDASKNVTDPDSVLANFRWVLDSAYPQLIIIHGGIIVFDFPLDFLDDGERSRQITVTVTVLDQDNLLSTDNMTVTVMRNVVVTSQNTVLWLGLLGSAGALACLSVYAVTRRRKPFVVRDMMLIHNDGFLISRYASPHLGEIDEDVLSGMLTAVLNFVEDSMSSSQDQLKTFGFKEYQVLVSRGTKTFVAVVYEGDIPSDIDKPISEFIAKIEKIYRKKISEWTGDIETDFAGASVLLESFVKEHDKGSRKKQSRSLWTSKKKPSVPEPK